MPRSVSHFKLGLFLIAGALLLAGAAVLFSASALWRETLPAETYFDESIQGLDVGAPVKFRGVQIGRVEAIGFLPRRYHATEGTARYVLVDMELFENTVEEFLYGREPEEVLPRLVTEGLRIRMTSQGLTGVSFLELNFYDPELNPVLPITWDPESIYFPSAPSTLSRLEQALDSIAKVLKKFEGIDFGELAQTLDAFVKSLTQALQEADVGSLGELVGQNLSELRSILSRVDELLSDPAAEQLVPDAAATAAAARRILEENEGDVAQTLQTARRVAERLENAAASVETFLANPKLQQSADKIPETLSNIEAAADDMRRAATQLRRLLQNVDDLLVNERSSIETILEDAQSVLRNLDSVTGDMKQNPSRFIFGRPPSPIDPQQDR